MVNPGSELWREVRRRDGSSEFNEVNQGLLLNELLREMRKGQQMPVLGLAGCLLLAAFIPWRVQAVGAGIVIGLVILRRLVPQSAGA